MGDTGAMERCACPAAVLLLSLVLMGATAFEVEIKDDKNATCIYAKLSVNITVQYETDTSSSKNITFPVPSDVTTNGSSCGSDGKAPLLVINFGNSQSWSLNFTRNNSTYSGSALIFTYNTNDTILFPDALRKGLISSTAMFLGPVPLNSTYKCISREVVVSENVTQIIYDVKLEAFMANGTLGKEIICDADKPSPVPSPTQPSTTASTAIPAPTSKPLDKPTMGNYTVSDASGICLLASMGLQINTSLLSEGKNIWRPFNIDPLGIKTNGTCTNQTGTLILTENRTIIEFTFALKNKNHFYLEEVNITLINGSAFSSRQNQNLSTWEASVDSSYMCHKEQQIKVSEDLFINAFDVRVQPFGVNNGTFATAEDCFADQNFIVPIVVGAALGVLVVLVMVAYFIGRRKQSSAGYEQM
ncbi:lysosome-associated membrane glycoprotein 2 precursor [Xenopus laevis]|uniref:Lysosome-associated membrane glycoprotein 2 n=1 Tax=Xenopus laevis TaxID=8355 RepID=Q641C6_XENLA|nr:lysosome-associated membrane glycoprotein 2 precursor [Xenopus laevis]AAH82411.1 MGC82091 protein [Xenopus laevis]